MSTPVRFGRYLLDRRLAIGGMAEVFLGRIEGPEGFEKRVVIKRILPHLQDDQNHVQMFLDEARLAARFDHPNMLVLDDGSFGVVDFKTSLPHKEHIPFYSRQLHAYAYALEHPAPNRLGCSPITRLGLYVETPHATLAATTSQISFHFQSTWLEVPLEGSGFLGFLDRVLALLELPEPPPAGEHCEYCRYRQHSREHGM